MQSEGWRVVCAAEEESCLFTKFTENLKIEHNFEMYREVKGIKRK